ncbi:MAG: SLC13 family permease [Promethearchaeota archaeon]
MWITNIIILGCFIGVVLLILTNKLNRAIAALLGALIAFFTLVFIENLGFQLIVEFLFGSPPPGGDNFVNLHSLILILSMMIIVQIAHEAGLFQFISISLIKLTGERPIYILIIFSVITVILSSILNNILTVIILIPLIITVSRILNINPSPYILTQAILVNIGGTFFSISSIPNILITSYAKISFIDFFLNVGVISLLTFPLTLLFFIFLYKKDLETPTAGFEILKEINIWNFVQNRILLYKSAFALVITLILFIIVPPTIISIDIVALTVALILIISSRLNAKEIIRKIDFELLLYLLGIFIISGALEYTGILDLLGSLISSLTGGDPLNQILIIIWFSGYLSSNIDNIPITKVLIPVIDNMPKIPSIGNINQPFYSLALGANWGDNLTPLGDNILVANIAEQNKRPISMKKFFKLGFFTTNFQLLIVSLYYILMYQVFIGILMLLSIFSILVILYVIHKFTSKKVETSRISRIIARVRSIIIK